MVWWGEAPSIRGYHVKKYETDLLGKTVGVRIEAESDDKKNKLVSKLSESIERINDNASKLSKSDINIIRGVNGFTVDDMKITGINPENGIYNIRSSYLLGSTSTVAWIASTIAHDSFHRYQFLQGQKYNLDPLGQEQAANRFQIRTGRFFGLTPYQIEWIQKDKHTKYNPTGQ